MRKNLIGAGLVVVPVLAIAGFAYAGGGQSSLDAARDATAAFHDIEVAKQAGYTVELAESIAFGGLTDGSCIANKDAAAGGAMGVHMVSLPLVGDGVIDAAAPEALLYERRNNGTFKLIGVEYVSPTPGSVFGTPLVSSDVSRFFGPGATLYTLHAWLWKPNPNGVLSPWNTRVSC